MEASAANIENMVMTLSDSALSLCIKIVAALAIYIIGRLIIGKLVKIISASKGFNKIDETARVYILSFIKATLYAVLVICIVAQLGVAMSSVVALLATAAAAVGLAMQGSLSNFAGGLMLLIFRPFKVGDFIVSGEFKGVVQSISLVYTTILTADNSTVLVPNGTLMNSTIVNNTSEEIRRVDLSFDISSSEDADKIRALMTETALKCDDVLKDPEPAVAVTAVVTDGVTYTVRVWVNTPDYLKVYEGLTEEIAAALGKAGIAKPSMPVRIDGEGIGK